MICGFWGSSGENSDALIRSGADAGHDMFETSGEKSALGRFLLSFGSKC